MLNFDPWVQQLSLYWTSWVGRLFVASYLIRVGSVFAFFFAFSRNSDTIPSNAASLFSFNILPSHERIGQRTIKRSWPSSSKFLLFCARKKKRRVHYMIDHFFRFEVFSTHCSRFMIAMSFQSQVLTEGRSPTSCTQPNPYLAPAP
jgi:hypothetical protein